MVNKYTKNKKKRQWQSGTYINTLYKYFRDLNKFPQISDKINVGIDNDIAKCRIQYDNLNQILTKQITLD